MAGANMTTMIQAAAWNINGDTDKPEMFNNNALTFPLHSFVVLHHIDLIGGAGVHNTSWTVLFMRPETLDYYKYLCEPLKREPMEPDPESTSDECPVYAPRTVTIVNSCPGVGKSTTLFLHFQEAIRVSATGTVGIWFNVEENRLVVFTKSEKAVLIQPVQTVPMDEVCRLLASSLQNAMLFVMDGAQNGMEINILRTIYDLRYANSDMRVYVTSSMGFNIEYKYLYYKDYFVIPWSLKTYHFMMDDRKYYNMALSVLVENPLPDYTASQLEALYPRRHEFVERKYKYAGHSCRWMLCYTYDRVLKDMNMATSRILNTNDLVAFGRAGSVVDRLFCCLTEYGTCVFMSDVVCRKLAGFGDLRFIRTATNRAQGGSFDGQVLEMDVLHHACWRRLHERILYLSEESGKKVLREGHEKRFFVDHCFPFDRLDKLKLIYDVDVIPNSDECTCLFPEYVENGGFDCVLLSWQGTHQVPTESVTCETSEQRMFTAVAARGNRVDRYDRLRPHMTYEAEDWPVAKCIANSLEGLNGSSSSAAAPFAPSVGGSGAADAAGPVTSTTSAAVQEDEVVPLLGSHGREDKLSLYWTRSDGKVRHPSKVPAFEAGVCAEFLQISRGATHSLKLEQFETFIDLYNSQRVDVPQQQIKQVKITFVIPVGHHNKFKVPESQVTGAGRLRRFRFDHRDGVEIVCFVRADRDIHGDYV